MRLNHFAAAVAVAAVAAGGAQASGNLLVNGDFETGDFSGWTVTPPGGGGVSGGNSHVAANGFVHNGVTYNAESGTYFAALGANGSDATLSQTFADVPGGTYAVTFYLASDGETPNDFSVTGPGSLLLPTMSDIPASPYVPYSGYFTGTGSDTITFTSRDDPGYLSLDDVSVTFVPEPVSWATMILGLGVAGVALRRRRAPAAA